MNAGAPMSAEARTSAGGTTSAGDATTSGPRRRPWLGLRTELLIVLPAALLLLVVVSTFTLFSYRGALLRLAEERQSEATRLARGIADHLVAAGAAPLPAAERLQQLAPGATGAGLLAASGMILAASGELPPLALPAAPAARDQPFALGPDADLPDSSANRPLMTSRNPPMVVSVRMSASASALNASR